MKRSYRSVEECGIPVEVVPRECIEDSLAESIPSTTRLKEMELENQDLRKRCTRLETIVNQILTNKGQSEDSKVEEEVCKEEPSQRNDSNYEIYDVRTSYNSYASKVSPLMDIPSKICEKHTRSPPLRRFEPLEKIPSKRYRRSLSPSSKAENNAMSPEEMEKRNEYFRSTYYEDHLKGTKHCCPTKNHILPYHSSENLLAKYHSSVLSKETFNGAKRPVIRKEVLYEPRAYHIPSAHLTRIAAPHSRVPSRVVYVPERLSPSPPSVHRRTPTKYHHNTGSGIDAKKYSNDFFTKLPPKLHIVESQNKNGVTLTWNATSNTDSSLVKTYQLFARELFGHKVGTMKRMGIIDALPLPMSCNIANLKLNIKYKFAVCAVDIYGRFGKMSNFTGKFELKSSVELLDDYNEDNEIELEIIV